MPADISLPHDMSLGTFDGSQEASHIFVLDMYGIACKVQCNMD